MAVLAVLGEKAHEGSIPWHANGWFLFYVWVEGMYGVDFGSVRVQVESCYFLCLLSKEGDWIGHFLRMLFLQLLSSRTNHYLDLPVGSIKSQHSAICA